MPWAGCGGSGSIIRPSPIPHDRPTPGLPVMIATRTPAFSVATALAAVLLLGAGTADLAAQPAAPTSAASAPSFAVRPEVAAALNQAIERHREGKVAEARALIEQAQTTTPNLQPAELTVLHRVRGLIELQLEQYAAAAQSLRAALETGAQSPADSLQCQEALARAQFNLKDYTGAAETARLAQAAGSRSPLLQTVLVRATYLQNDYRGTIELLQEQQQRQGKLPVDELRLLASAYGQAGDEAGYLRVAEQLLREHGRKEYWPDLVSRVRQQPGWQARWDIDLQRLRLRLGLVVSADEFLALADMEARAGLPAQALKVIDAGYAKGVLGKGPNEAEHERLRSSLRRQAEDDRKSLAAAAARPPSASSDARAAAAAFNTGAALVSIGQAGPGLQMMKAALEGSLADPAQAHLQYGEALVEAGQPEQAAAAFRAIDAAEPLALLARLWALAVSDPGQR